jgi:hypothetical protein
MNKRITQFAITALAIALAMPSFAQVISHTWSKQYGGTKSAIVNSLATDASGNVYSIGYFEETADFDPGPGIFNLTSGGKTDIFVAKLDADGGFLWAKNFSGPGSDRGYSLAADGSGNIYVTGGFGQTVDFDPGPATVTLTAIFPESIFICKLDPDGNLIWVKQFQSTVSNHRGSSITIDPAGDIITAGFFDGPTDLDPGPGTFNLTSSGNGSGFVAKFNTEGGFIWATRFAGDGNCYVTGIDTDISGSIVASGYYSGTADFDPGPATTALTAAGGSDCFVVKLTGEGVLSWARSMGGPSGDYGNSIAADRNGNSFITGYFFGTADFDPGTGIASLTAPSNNIFVCKLTSSGDLAWARSFNGSSTDYGKAIALDPQGRVYVTGTFKGTTDFDPGPAVSSLTTKGDLDFFICKISSEGDFIRVNQMAGSGYETGTSIFVDERGTILAAGYFSASPDFDPGPGSSTLTAIGPTDAFLVKLSQETSSIPILEMATNPVIYPNPTQGLVTISTVSESGWLQVRVRNVLGSLIEHKFQSSGRQMTIDLTKFEPGIYFIETEDNNHRTIHKVIKQ